jgi:hypothetical protein
VEEEGEVEEEVEEGEEEEEGTSVVCHHVRRKKHCGV